MVIGHAKVSTLEQNERLQTDALDKAGCERVLIIMRRVRGRIGRSWTDSSMGSLTGTRASRGSSTVWVGVCRTSSIS